MSAVAESFDRQGVAERAGVDLAFVDRLVALGILTPGDGDRFTTGDVQRVGVAVGLERGGLSLEAVGDATRRGDLSFSFVDQPSYNRFGAVGSESFEELSGRTGIPLEVLMTIREAMGFAQPSPQDRVRDDELLVVPLIELQLREGFRTTVIERWLRVYGESMRRVADTEADWFRSEILEPLFASGKSSAEIGESTGRLEADLARFSDQAILALFHGHEANAWMKNIFEGFESTLTAAGAHTPLDRPSAICFLDLTGYTRITEERGDEAAADLAARLARIVQRTSAQHDGRVVKWLGDGVMFQFRDPGSGVLAALEMVGQASQAELPPAHVGLHAGPVLFQAGDFFGRTVNAAARIADYARQGEVLVSQEVVDASGSIGVEFTEIGPVELKGLAGALRLHVARRTPT
jgi:adenylate cyclase